MDRDRETGVGATFGLAWDDWGTWLGAALVLCVALEFGALRLLPEGAGTVVSAFLVLVSDLVAVALLLRVAIHPKIDRRTRHAWGWLGGGLAVYTIGDFLYALYSLGVLPGEGAFPSPADFFFLGFYAVTLYGLLRFPGRLWSRADRIDLALDVTALVFGGAMIVWLTLVVSSRPFGPIGTALVVAYPVLSLVLLLAFTAVLGGQRLTRSHACLAVWLLTDFAGNLVYSARASEGFVPEGAWTGSITLLSAGAFLGLAAFLRYAEGDHEASPLATTAAPFNVVVQTIVILGYLLLLVDLYEQRWPAMLGGLILGGTALTLVSLLRLGRAVGENLRHVTERESEARFRSLIQNASDLILVVDRSFRVIYEAPSVERLLGSGVRTGLPLTDHLEAEDRVSAEAYLDGLLTGHTVGVTAEWHLLRPGGGSIPVEVVGANRLLDPSVTGLVVTARSIHERKRLEAQLSRQALYDPVTGLANRVLFGDRLERAVMGTHRNGGSLSVLLVDLDDFKDLNDALGQAAGDQLLACSAHAIEGCLPSAETVARLVGDEFAVILEGAGRERASEVAEAIQKALGDPIDIAGRSVRLEASLGIAVLAASETGDELLRNADLAMYEAKRAGKGRTRVFEPGMHTAVVTRLESITSLRLAYERGDFRLLYQPIYELPTGRVVGLEALVRRVDPDGTLVSPLGDFVIEAGFRFAASWGNLEEAPYLSLNVSTRQLQDPGFGARLQRMLGAFRLEPERVTLEITESRLMSSPDVSLRLLRDLKGLGVHLAIDDFGTGYASLAYLRSLPVDILKIDRSFARGLERDTRSAGLVKGILELARALGLGVVAEGIEEIEQARTLVSLGCQHAQGFLFARPLSEDAVSLILADRARETRRVLAEADLAIDGAP
jgi:diguanylate cyclase (GGDEF)-like protein/PAS domain S-box-containing protein